MELFEGLEGLVHVSELSPERIEKPEDHFQVGQQVRVKIIKMDPAEQKVGLSIKAALDEPDPEAVQAYFEGQPGDGSATLGDVISADLLHTGETEGGTEAEVPEAGSAPTEEVETKTEGGADEDAQKET